jgi:seryl-tRNA synthetase
MEAWTQTVAEAKHQRRLIRKVAQRFQNRHLSQCYGRWAAQVRASQRQRELEHVESWKQKLQSSISKLEGDLSTMSNDFQESIQDLTARVQADQHSVTEMTDQLHDSLQALTTRIDSTVCADEFADVVRRVSVPPPSTRPFLVAVYSHYIALRRLMELRHGRTRRQFGCPLRSGHN